MTSEAVIARAFGSLAGRRLAQSDAAELVAKRPGLYAFYGDDRAWLNLGLRRAYDGQPLYVGKAEKESQRP